MPTNYMWGLSVGTSNITLEDVAYAKTVFANFKEKPATPPKIKHLKQENSPNCCGCDFMSWFPQNVPTPQLLKEVEEQLAEQEPIYNSMMLVILNNLQKPYYHDMLVKRNYKVMMDGVYHPDHGHDLTLYGWQKFKESPNKARS